MLDANLFDRSRRLQSAGLIVGLVWSGSVPVMAQDAAAPAAPLGVTVNGAGGSVIIDVVDPFTRSHAAEPLRTKTNALLEALAAKPTPLAGPWTARMEVRGHLRNFEVNLLATGPGGRTIQAEPIACACLYDELPNTIEPHLRSLLEQFEDNTVTAAATPPSPQAMPVEEPPSTSTRESSVVGPARRKGLGALGGVGVGLLAVGTAGAVIGIVRAAQGTDVRSGELSQQTITYQTPTSIGLGIAGGAMMAAGLAMLVIDQTVCRRRPPGCRLPRNTAYAGTGFTLHF